MYGIFQVDNLPVHKHTTSSVSRFLYRHLIPLLHYYSICLCRLLWNYSMTSNNAAFRHCWSSFTAGSVLLWISFQIAWLLCTFNDTVSFRHYTVCCTSVLIKFGFKVVLSTCKIISFLPKTYLYLGFTWNMQLQHDLTLQLQYSWYKDGNLTVLTLHADLNWLFMSQICVNDGIK